MISPDLSLSKENMVESSRNKGVFLWSLLVWVALAVSICGIIYEFKYHSRVDKMGYPRVTQEVSNYSFNQLKGKNLLVVMDPLKGSSTPMGFAVSANNVTQILGRSRMGNASPSFMQGNLVPTGINVASSLEDAAQPKICIESIGCYDTNPETGIITQNGHRMGRIVDVVPEGQTRPSSRF